MILTTFTELHDYTKINPLFSLAADWLQYTDLTQLAIGEHEIKDRELFAIKATMMGRKPNQAKLEAHKKYIDIQVCIQGTDNIAWRPTIECPNISDAYKAENDIMFFSDKATHSIKIHNDKIALFFPNDAHAPLIADEELTKIVIKVLA